MIWFIMKQQKQEISDDFSKEIIVNFLCNVSAQLFCAELFNTQQDEDEIKSRLERIEEKQLELQQILSRIEDKLNDRMG